MRCDAPTEQPITIRPEGGRMSGEGIKGAEGTGSEAEGRRKQVCEKAEILGNTHHTLNQFRHNQFFQKRPPEY